MAKQTKSEKQQEEEVLKDICTSNGLQLGELHEQGQSCFLIEMFFSGMPRMVGLAKFPNLQVLCIMGQTISKIENLSHCPTLTELWLCEMQIIKIEGLENLKHLRKLFLYDNEIKKIENLRHLSELETLWLNVNQIKEIEGLADLKHLTELSLAKNQISKIGNTLNGLVHLEKLELSGNKIFSFKDLTYLQKLPHLKELGVKSPGYPPNPVGLLCNYSTHVLYHMPNLDRLDQLCFSNTNVKEISETTVKKKKMYYNMRSKTVWRNFSEMEAKLRDLKKYILKPPNDRIRTLAYVVKELECELRELECPRESSESGTESDKDARDDKAAEVHLKIGKIKEKIPILMKRIEKWEKKITEVEAYYTEGIERIRATSELQVHRLVNELEMGGNIRFENGTQDDIWFSSCHDLILSRFCAADFSECGIVGIKIHRITRIHNRVLRMKFEDTLAAELDDEDAYFPPNKNASYKKLLEYLFWIWDPELPGGANEPQRVLEDGFMDAATYKQLGKEAAVPLTNSISIADRFRIKHSIKQAKTKEYRDTCPFRHGQIIVSKVYVGKSSQCSESKPIDKHRYPKSDTVFKPRKEGDEKTSLTNLGLDKLERASSVMSMGDLCQARTPCECTGRQSEWFVFNHNLAMPEYVVDFEYITALPPKSPFLSHEDGLKATREKSLTAMDELPSDDDITKMEPEIEPRVRIMQLTTDAMLRMSGASTLENITVLDLHGNGLAKLKGITSLTNLDTLIVSFNELTRLDDIGHMNLQTLDASFNKISSLEGLKSMTTLKYLDLTWNSLQNTREDVSILRKHCPILSTLDLRHNHWQKKEGLRLRAIGRIKTLTMLNGASVQEQESAAALRMAAGSRISQVSLLSHSRTDTARPRSLSLASSAQILSTYSRNRPDRSGDQDNLWISKVTTLNLDGQHISKISNVERLDNLRFASFNDNDITRIEGLEGCVNLEELSLEHNCITRIDGLSKLTKLRRLSLGHNYIVSLENCGLDRLPNLQYLSLESNRIKSLVGVQRNSALVELYVGNNRIENLREVFVLKALSALVILDLFGNPVAIAAENYRLFVIYHLKGLKALDGTAIEALEGSIAKDTFGGRLTQDFVAERLNHSNFNDVKEMDFPQSNIRSVDLGNGELFLNLRSVNLENNSLTSFSGLIYLVNLRVLCLNHNHIECIVPRTKAHSNTNKAPRSVYSMNPPVANVYSVDVHTPVLESLEVLHLGYNGIKDMAALQLSRLTSLKALFLQGNEITQIAGLEMLQDLRELVLDRNKIKNITEYSFVNQWNLQELHLEENRLKDLSNIGVLENLQRLFLGMNRIQDMLELEKLDPLYNLVEFSIVSNAVARRMLHRPLLVFRLPTLHIIDGIPITEEERCKADTYFVEQQPQQPNIHSVIETNLPGIGSYKAQIPVKVTNMQLVSGPYAGQNWSGTLHLNEDVLQGRRALNPNEKRPEVTSNGVMPNKVTGTMTYQHGASLPGGRSGNQSNQQQSRTHQLSNIPYVPHQEPNKGNKR